MHARAPTSNLLRMRELILRALALDDPSAAFAASDTIARLLLAARVTLLFLAWLGLVARDDRAQRVAFAIACGLFVGSLAIVALFVPFALSALVVCVRHVAVASSRTRFASAIGAIFAISMLVLGSQYSARPAPAPPEDVAGLTAYWLDRENLFEARFWATQWAGAERERPGEGQLLLARIDWELGHRDAARSLLADVVARAPSPDARRRAATQLATWPSRDETR